MTNRLLFLFIPVLLLSHFSVRAASPQSSYRLGISSFKAGDYATAISAFEEAAKQGYAEPKLYMNLANAYLKIKGYEKADEQYSLAMKYDNWHDLALFQKAKIAFTLNDYDKANLDSSHKCN